MPKISFPTINLMRDYFNDPDLGKAIITELENKEIGSVAGNDGYYYEHRVKEELFEVPDTPYYVIANQKEINPVKFFGIDIPVLLKSPFKNTTETIILVGQDPLRSIEHIRDGFKDGGINTIHEGTPYAIEIDTNATKGNTSNLECYRPIIFELLKNYNVYLTDALKCWICDSTGENVSFNCLNPKLKKIIQKTPEWLLEQEIACLESGKNTLNEKLKIQSFIACLGGNAYEKVCLLNTSYTIHKANHPSNANSRKYPNGDKTTYIVHEILGTLSDEEKAEFIRLNPKTGKADPGSTKTGSNNTNMNTSIADQIRQKLIDEGLITNKRDESKFINSILDATNQTEPLIRYKFENRDRRLMINVYWKLAGTKKNTKIMETILALLNKNKTTDTTTQCFICSYDKTPDEIVEAVKEFESKLCDSLKKTNLAEE